MHFNVNGHDILFVNQSRDTRHGFAHDTTLFIDDIERSRDTCHYLNRTWECYQYQTVMQCAVRKLKDARREELRNRFMSERGYKKMTASRKEEFETYSSDDRWLDFISAIYKKLER